MEATGGLYPHGADNPQRAPRDRNLWWLGRAASSLLAIPVGALLSAASAFQFGDCSSYECEPLGTEFVLGSLPLLAALASLIPGRVRPFLIPLFLAGAAGLLYLSYELFEGPVVASVLIVPSVLIVTSLGLLFQAWHAFAFRNHN